MITLLVFMYIKPDRLFMKWLLVRKVKIGTFKYFILSEEKNLLTLYGRLTDKKNEPMNRLF